MEPDEHYVKAPRPQWRARHILALLIVLMLTFLSGLIIGRGGDYHIWHSIERTLNPTAAYKLDYSSVDTVYDKLQQNFDGKLDNKKLLDGLKSGLVNAAGDPYTVFFNKDDAKAFNNQLEGSIIGIGAELGRNDQNNIIVVSPLAGYPAEKAGLKSRDIIAAIDGKTTQGMTIDAAVSKIRGKEGTKVTLTIVRGATKPIEVTITRQKITVPSVRSEIKGEIGYIRITQFTNETVDLATKAANEFKAKQVKAVVLDLRGDPGGYLQAAVGVSSLWLDKGDTVVQEKRGGKVVSTEYASGGNILKGLPTAVLIDGGSASASEITAGALHDNDAASLVGSKSFGKGSVQQVENFTDGSELKVTIARWFTPDGKNIDKQGIKPDIEVALSDKDIAAGKDPQKDKAFTLVMSKL